MIPWYIHLESTGTIQQTIPKSAVRRRQNRPRMLPFTSSYPEFILIRIKFSICHWDFIQIPTTKINHLTGTFNGQLPAQSTSKKDGDHAEGDQKNLQNFKKVFSFQKKFFSKMETPRWQKNFFSKSFLITTRIDMTWHHPGTIQQTVPKSAVRLRQNRPRMPRISSSYPEFILKGIKFLKVLPKWLQFRLTKSMKRIYCKLNRRPSHT